MKMDNLMNNKLTGKTVALLSRALDFQSANHHVIAGNLANIDTPGYRPRTLNFDSELQSAMDRRGPSLKRTDPKHFSHPQNGSLHGKGSFRIKSNDGTSNKSGQLNIERTMAEMVQNNLLYEATVKLLTKKFEALKTAIDSGRR